MSMLINIEARANSGLIETGSQVDAAYVDCRYLLGLVKETIRIASNVRDSQESDLGAYSRWVGEQMTELLAKFEE